MEPSGTAARLRPWATWRSRPLSVSMAAGPYRGRSPLRGARVLSGRPTGCPAGDTRKPRRQNDAKRGIIKRCPRRTTWTTVVMRDAVPISFRQNQLHYFVTVADEGQITRAAQKLHVAQPALS